MEMGIFGWRNSFNKEVRERERERERERGG
jgi:hypothetical protein